MYFGLRETRLSYVALKVAELNDPDIYFDGAIELDRRIVGGGGLPPAFDRANRTLRSAAGGHGGTGRAAFLRRAGVSTAPSGPSGLHRVVSEPSATTGQRAAIPEGSASPEAGPPRGEGFHSRYKDALLYAMLASDWPPSPAREAIGSE